MVVVGLAGVCVALVAVVAVVVVVVGLAVLALLLAGAGWGRTRGRETGSRNLGATSSCDCWPFAKA